MTFLKNAKGEGRRDDVTFINVGDGSFPCVREGMARPPAMSATVSLSPCDGTTCPSANWATTQPFFGGRGDDAVFDSLRWLSGGFLYRSTN